MPHKISHISEGIVFSSELDEVQISIDGDFADVIISAEGDVLLQERYYAYEGVAHIYNVSELVENYMKSCGVSYANLKIEVLDSEGNINDTDSIRIIFCNRSIVTDSAADYIQENFLTSSNERRTPKNAIHYLFYYSAKDESVECKINYAVRLENDQVITSNMTVSSDESTDLGIRRIKIAQSSIIQDAAENNNVNPNGISLLTFTASTGQRSVTFWTDNSLALGDAFYFKNCFNAWDVIYLNGLTSAKTDVEVEKAVVENKHLLYDRRVDKSHEIKVRGLSAADETAIEQLVSSHQVMKCIGLAEGHDGNFKEILITDSTCEIDDDDENLNDISFKWRYADDRPLLFAEESKGIFTSQYNIVFS